MTAEPVATQPAGAGTSSTGGAEPVAEFEAVSVGGTGPLEGPRSPGAPRGLLNWILSLRFLPPIVVVIPFFDIVRQARDVGIRTVTDRVAAGQATAGWEVDRAVRSFIQKAGYGDYFIHRTGHSIATEIHSNGANMDDLEIHDERRILPNTVFSIEPGIYLPEFGVRSEVNMLVRERAAEVTGKIQREIVII